MLMLMMVTFVLLSKTQNYILLLSLYWQKTTKRYQSFLAKGLNYQCIEMNIKLKMAMKIPKMGIYIFFLESKIVGVNRFFVLIYSNQDKNAKRYKARRYSLRKDIIKNYIVVINGRNVYDQSINSDVKRYKQIRILTRGQSEDYPTGFSF